MGGHAGKAKRMAAARRAPSVQLSSGGLPSTAHSLYSWSTSDAPGNSGRSVNNSAMMAPHANWSIGEEYVVDRNRISGARYHRVDT